MNLYIYTLFLKKGQHIPVPYMLSILSNIYSLLYIYAYI